MKKFFRILSGATFATLGLTAATVNSFHWSDMGCDWRSISVGVAFYIITATALGYVMDQTIQGK